MPVTIYHNPRCSKSRQALEIIRSKGIEPDIIDYLKSPLSEKQIIALLRALGLEDPRALMRRGEDPYKNLDLGNPAKTKAQLIAAIVRHPVLMERPVVVTDKGAVIGRPPESITAIL